MSWSSARTHIPTISKENVFHLLSKTLELSSTLITTKPNGLKLDETDLAILSLNKCNTNRVLSVKFWMRQIWKKALFDLWRLPSLRVWLIWAIKKPGKYTDEENTEPFQFSSGFVSTRKVIGLHVNAIPNIIRPICTLNRISISMVSRVSQANIYMGIIL